MLKARSLHYGLRNAEGVQPPLEVVLSLTEIIRPLGELSLFNHDIDRTGGGMRAIRHKYEAKAKRFRHLSTLHYVVANIK